MVDSCHPLTPSQSRADASMFPMSPSAPDSLLGLSMSFARRCSMGEIPFVIHEGIPHRIGIETVPSTSVANLCREALELGSISGPQDADRVPSIPHVPSGGSWISNWDKSDYSAPELSSSPSPLVSDRTLRASTSPSADNKENKTITPGHFNEHAKWNTAAARPLARKYRHSVHDPCAANESSTRMRSSSCSGPPRRALSVQTNEVPLANCQESSKAQNDHKLHPVSRPYPVPDGLEWLKTVKVQLCIDQEGFRAIRPVFRFSRLVLPTVAASYNPAVHGIAEFKCQNVSEVYHHAAWDTPPVLRRLMVNDDETRDYTSREAYLSIRANGVYAIRGLEDRGRLVWQFEYTVQDKMCHMGKLIKGEKLLTPLGLSISPALLAPEKGRKVKLMRVVRKSVLPKLSAEQFVPPAPPAVSPILSAFLPHDADQKANKTNKTKRISSA